MRRPSLALLMALAGIVGCTPRTGSLDPAPGQPPADAPATGTPPPPGSRGKIAADQVGKVSPVPAFQGGGGDWRISIRAIGGMRHDVQLRWGGTTHGAGGTARYLPAEAAPGRHRLDGTLYGADGDRAMRITLQRGDCTGAGGRVQPYSVAVAVDGMAPLQGCGELALP
jgi:hypothetical protein